MICMAIAWGLVAMGFAVLNASTKPIETITGPVGLYLWNLLASEYLLLCACKCVIAPDIVCLPTLFIGRSKGSGGARDAPSVHFLSSPCSFRQKCN